MGENADLVKQQGIRRAWPQHGHQLLLCQGVRGGRSVGLPLEPLFLR